MLGRAEKIGVDSPTNILNPELDTAKAAIEACEKQQRYLLRGASSRALLADPLDEDQIIPRLIEDEERVADGINDRSYGLVRRRLFSQNDEIAYDYDEDEERSVYEI